MNPVSPSEVTPDSPIGSAKRQGLVVMVIAALSVLLVGALWLALPQLFDSWEMATYDLRMRWQGPGLADPAIVLIGRDEESDARFGTGIWDRAVFAKVIAGLGQAGAQTIALDFHMPGVSPPERGNGASDHALVAATTGAGAVLYPMKVSERGEGATVSPTLPDVLTRSLPVVDSRLVHALPQAGRVEGPFPALAAAAAGVGHIAAWPDADSVYRRVPTFIGVGERAVPALGVAMAANVLQVSPDHIELVPGEALRLRDARLPDGRQRTISVPVDAEGRLLIRYAGNWTDGSFPYLSFVNVYDAVAEGREAELREQVAGKLVILVHAALGSDKRRTPYEVSVPGGFILANVANTILTQQGVREAAVSTGWLVALVVSVGAAMAITMLPGWMGLLAVFTLGAMYVATTFVGMGMAIVLPVLSPLAALLLAALFTLGWARRHATDRVTHLENAQLALYRALATKQLLFAQQEARAEQLEDDVFAAKADAVTGVGLQTALERTIAALQQELQVAQDETDETRQSVKGLEEKLAAIQAARPAGHTLATDEQEQLSQECAGYGIVTRDPAVLRRWKDLKLAARSQTPIMILGEPGTGKELFAQAVHRFSARAAKPFVAVNMTAIPSDLFESQFFGHLRGSFTGAVQDHEGYVRQADGGTLFLDEIGDLRLDQQAKLLRVLQEQVVTRVGDRKAVKVDVRIVAATNKNLLQGIAEGWFREDLYYRLRGIELPLPPLRERVSDVPELAQRFIDQIVAKDGRRQIELSQGARECLKRWPWKGNVRELKHCVESAVILAQGPTIMEEDLRLGEASFGHTAPVVQAVASSDDGGDPKKSDTVLLRLLREHSFDRKATAAMLGWDRSTVMQRFKGMCFQALVTHDGDRTAAAADLAGEPGLTRLVEVQLTEYVDHLLKTARSFPTTDAAIAGCRKQFKNLQERYWGAVEALIRTM